MSILKEKFQQIKAAIAQAINFADPAEVLQKAEHAFMEASAEAYHALEERVVELEQKLQSLIDPTAKVGDEPPLEAGTATSGEISGATSSASQNTSCTSPGSPSQTDSSASASDSSAQSSSTPTTPDSQPTSQSSDAVSSAAASTSTDSSSASASTPAASTSTADAAGTPAA